MNEYERQLDIVSVLQRDANARLKEVQKKIATCNQILEKSQVHHKRENASLYIRVLYDEQARIFKECREFQHESKRLKSTVSSIVAVDIHDSRGKYEPTERFGDYFA